MRSFKIIPLPKDYNTNQMQERFLSGNKIYWQIDCNCILLFPQHVELWTVYVSASQPWLQNVIQFPTMSTSCLREMNKNLAERRQINSETHTHTIQINNEKLKTQGNSS